MKNLFWLLYILSCVVINELDNCLEAIRRFFRKGSR